MIFSTWQYTLNPPSCCPSESKNITLNADQAEGCKELQRDILLSSLNLHIPPSINITTSIIAVVVCEAIVQFSMLIIANTSISPPSPHVHGCAYTHTAIFNQHWYTLDTECLCSGSVWWWRRKCKSHEVSTASCSPYVSYGIVPPLGFPLWFPRNLIIGITQSRAVNYLNTLRFDTVEPSIRTCILEMRTPPLHYVYA